MQQHRLRTQVITISVAMCTLLIAALVGGHTRPAKAGAPAVQAAPVAARASQTPVSQPHPAWGARCKGLVALTFDDGPSTTVTVGLVKTLKRMRVPATFFMVGQRIAAAPAVARYVARSGFEIGNHTWAHADLAAQSPTDIFYALRRVSVEMHKDHVKHTKLMRPPYGALDATALKVIRHFGLVPVLWTIDSLDWQSGTSEQIAERIVSALKPGPDNIVLQHDGVNRSPISARAVPLVVHRARQRGYCFVGLGTDGKPLRPVGYGTHRAPHHHATRDPLLPGSPASGTGH